SDNGSKNDVPAESEHVVEAACLLQTHILVVPQVGGILLRPMEHEVLTFRPPIKMGVLVDRTLIDAGNKASFLNKSWRYVQILHIKSKPPPGADQRRVVVLAETVSAFVQGRAHVTAIT